MTASYLIDTDWVIGHFNGIASVSARLRELAPTGAATDPGAAFDGQAVP